MARQPFNGPSAMHATEFYGRRIPLQVLRSAAGYYLGSLDSDGCPLTRESVEYWPTEAQAQAALASKGEGWTQRDHP